MDIAKNFAKVTVSDGNYDADDTSIVLLSGEGGKLPTAPFNVVWWNATDYPDPSDDPGVEIVRVTAKATDTLTVTRGQEGTSGQDHNVAGKTYKMIACLTAKVINLDLVGDVNGSGPAVWFDLTPAQETAEFRHSNARKINLGNTAMEVQSTLAYIGDFNAEGNASYLIVDDTATRLTLNGMNLATTQTESASGPVGTVVGKLAIRDGAGDIIGYLPIYNSIT